MKIYVYLDESGSIHKNSNTKYFAVGGYFVFANDKNKVISFYKKINKIIKTNKNISFYKEIKSFDMTVEEKIKIFNAIQDIDTFYGCVKVFDKKTMRKEIVESNIFFNYAIKILFKDCIIPLLNISPINENIEFIISIDNRNIRIGDLNNLETYLKTEFCLQNFNFKIIVNTFYNLYKNKNIVKDIIPYLKSKNFRVSLFPGYKTKGKTQKIEYNINEDI